MYIILSLLLSIFNLFISIKEMKVYNSIGSKLKKCIYIYPFFTIMIFYFCENKLFSLFFGAITPLLISHFIIDTKEQELPDLSNLIIFIFGLLLIIFTFISSNFSDLLLLLKTHLLTGILLFITYLTISLITGGQIGGGDIKLVGALGIFFPIEIFTKLLIYPILLGAIFAIVLLITKKGNKDTKFAFGPSIIFAFYIIAINLKV